jgi:integrase
VSAGPWFSRACNDLFIIYMRFWSKGEWNVETADVQKSKISTVAEAVVYWLQNREGEVRDNTMRSYRQVSSYIIGPLLIGNRTERYNFSRRGSRGAGAQFIEMIGPKQIRQLTTVEIRTWHKTLTVEVGGYTANVAKKFLRAALSMAAEDFSVPLPPMPARLGRGRPRAKKAILTPDQVGRLLQAAVQDAQRGIYYAFPFLTGVRPSEQLALLWDDVRLDEGVIDIRRTQLPNGFSSELTKTSSSARRIPISPLLRTMLLNWRNICPQVDNSTAWRVFPCLGVGNGKRHKTTGRALSYTNFIYTYWRPSLKAAGVPLVTPHSARHTFISTLQASGVELGLVAKLAGHSNVAVTLGHYTQAVRGGEVALQSLESAYRNTPLQGG